MAVLNLNKEELELLNDMVSYFAVHSHCTGREDKLRRKIERAGIPIKISSRKGKGRALQQKVCRDISSVIGIPYDQQDDECLIHSREMGQSGVDVILRGEAKGLFPYSIESKSAEAFSLTAAIEQAENNQAEGTDWMVIHKRKAWKVPVVILSWDVFIEMYRGFINIYVTEE